MAYDHTRSRRARSRPDPAAVSRAELDGFVVRLRACGATDDEVAATVASWDDFDTNWTPAARRQMVRWSDGRIRDELAAVRAEYVEHTTP